MLEPDRPLSLHRRTLAERLKALREEAGLSGRGLAAELGWSQSKVSRGERGDTMLPVADIARWLRRCGASPEEEERLLAIAEEAAVEAVAIRHLNRWGHAAHQRRRIDRERTARSIAIYQPEVVPGLLQLPDYSRELLLALGTCDENVVWESVRARAERQEAVAASDAVVHTIITAAALAWQPGSLEVLRRQLDALQEQALNGHARIGVVTYSAMRRAKTCNAFELIEWPDGSAEVDIETLTTESTLSEPTDVGAYQAMLNDQERWAVYGPDAAAEIAALRADLH